MKQLIIQIKTHARSHPVDYQFPGEIPIGDLLPFFVQSNGWPQKDDEGQPLFYWFEYQNKALDDELTLLDSGIHHGVTLLIKSGSEKPIIIKEKRKVESITSTKSKDIQKEKFSEPPEPKELVVEFEPLFIPQNISIQDRRSQITAPSTWTKIDNIDINR